MHKTAYGTRLGRIALALALAATLAAALSCVLATNAHAATTFSKRIMYYDDSYSSSKYDITGDKKADRLTIKSYGGDGYDYFDKVRVYVNGKRKLTLPTLYSSNAILLRIKSGRTFLFLETLGEGYRETEGIYTYKGGKLVKVLNTDIFPSCCHGDGTPYHRMAHFSDSNVSSISVSGSTVRIKFHNVNTITGRSAVTYSFKYSDGKLRKTSSTSTSFSINERSSKKVTAATSFPVYRNSNSTGKVTKVKKGARVTLKAVQIRPSDHFISVKVTSGSTTGWITCKSFKGLTYSSLHDYTLFKEATGYLNP